MYVPPFPFQFQIVTQDGLRMRHMNVKTTPSFCAYSCLGGSQSETKNKGSNLDVIAIVLINNNQNFQELVIFMRPPLAVFIRHSFLSIWQISLYILVFKLCVNGSIGHHVIRNVPVCVCLTMTAVPNGLLRAVLLYAWIITWQLLVNRNFVLPIMLSFFKENCLYVTNWSWNSSNYRTASVTSTYNCKNLQL